MLYEVITHRKKRAQGSDGRTDDRPADLAGRLPRRLDPSLPLLHVAIDVLDNDDGVVDQHAERQDQAEQHNHVEGHAERLDDGERHQHRKGDRQRDEEVV